MAGQTRQTIFDGVSTTAQAEGSEINIAALDPAVNDFTIRLRVNSLEAGKKANVLFEDTENNFTAAITRIVQEIVGPITEHKDFAWRHKQDFSAMRFGVTSAELRLRTQEISASSNLDMEAWIEY